MAEEDDSWMLTTTDNPYNPFTQYKEWTAFDAARGYHTPSYLARIVVSSDELSEHDQRLAINTAIDEILEMNLFGVHRKVRRSDFPSEIQTSGG